jgi:ribosomal protein L37AE/L43A
MAKPKASSVEFLGCELCGIERNLAAIEYKREHGHKATSEHLPPVMMATAQCQAWFKPLVSITNQEGSVHDIPICDRHTVERSGILLCTACAKEEPKPLGYKRPKPGRRSKRNEAQTSIFDVCEAAA